jgi:periplasmic protein TonB
MYGAMSEHAPSSTRLTGLVSAAALTLAMGYALATGMGLDVRHVLPDPIAYVALPDEPKAEPAPTTAESLDTSSETQLLTPPVDLNLPDFEVEQGPIGVPGPPSRPGAPEAGAAVPPPNQPVRVAAKLLPAPPPPYPAAQIRLRQEGNTGLAICIDRNGRVSSATLASSSGSDKLDEAALKWVRSSRFKPATLDGAPQPVCGHSVVYEWRLEDAR